MTTNHPPRLEDVKPNGPFFCADCGITLVLDGYPERIDGPWIHLTDWREKNRTDWNAAPAVNPHDAWNYGYLAAMEDRANPRSSTPNPYPAPALKVPQL